jgi:hypothetical protein
MWARVGQLESMVSTPQLGLQISPSLQPQLGILTEFFFMSLDTVVAGASIFLIFNGIAMPLFVTMYVSSRPVQ